MGYLQEKEHQCRVNVMYITKYKKIDIIERKKKINHIFKNDFKKKETKQLSFLLG